MAAPLTPALLLKALDGLSLRTIATAQNIANANSPGYRPIGVTFEAALAQAAERRSVAAVADVTPRVVPMLNNGAPSALRLDLEMATATQTAGRYSALAELLNRRLQIEALGVTGTR